MDKVTPTATLAAPELSPQAQVFLDGLGPRRGGLDRPIEEVRHDAREAARRYNGTPERVASIEDVDAGGVRARLYRPENELSGVFVWFHGGAWTHGGLDDYDTLASAIANRAKRSVLSVDYRLAPEHRYPAALDDCWIATKWAVGEFDSVAVGGDSAGGNLAAAVALRARDSGIRLALQLLVYPVLDAELDSTFLQDFILRYRDFAGDSRYGEHSVAGLRYVWEVYAPDPERRADVYASPMRATTLEGVTPALIILAEHDPLRGEGEEYARRLEEANVPVELKVYAGQIHGFYSLLAAMDDGWDAVARSAAALTTAFQADAADHAAVSHDG